MKKLLLLIGLAFSLTMNAQAPTIQWEKDLGGTGEDVARSVQPTPDGGYIVAGQTFSNNGDVAGYHGFGDVWVVKLSATGTIIWQKALGGTGEDWANSVQTTPDGGYIVAGYTYSNNGDVTGFQGVSDAWVVKLSATGTIEWQKTLGGGSYESAFSVQPTTDGGYIVAGYTNSNNGDVLGNHGSVDAWLVKLSATGTIVWQKCLGGTNYDFANSIQTTIDGGYIVAGYTNSNNGDVTGNYGSEDAWVVKLSATGNIVWQKCLGGTNDDFANSIQPTTDGGYIMAGYTSSNNGDVIGNHGSEDAWVVKLSATGTIVWRKCLGGTGNDVANSIQPTPDGGYIMAGYTSSNNGDVTGNNGLGDAWVVKLSTTGAIVWQKTLGGTSNDEANAIKPTTDGGYILAVLGISTDGVTGNHGGNGDFWLVKLSPDIFTFGYCQSMSFSNLSNMPTNRGLIASATDGNNIYVCNGMSTTVASTTQIEKYNISTNAWSTFSNTNSGLRYASAEVVNNKLYVFNGAPSSVGTTFNNKMEVVDLTTGIVTYSTNNPLPVFLAGSSVWNGKIYSFGGTSSAGKSAKLYVFDTVLQTWTVLADMPEAKETKGEIINGKLYVIGGFNSAFPAYSTSIDCYDIQTNTWSHLMDMPNANSANATSAYENKIWIIGDYTNQNFVGYYDVLTNQFVSIQSNIIARRHAGTIALNNNLYAFGGVQTPLASSSLNSLQVANIADFTNVPNVGYTTPQTYTIGTPIIPLTPINTSGSCSLTYNINPALPSGLTLDTATGIISGTPTATSPFSTYSITACNNFVCVTSTLVLSNTLGTTEFSNISLKLYPNPTHSLINIQTSNSVVLDKIIITDLTGKTVVEQTQNTNQVSVEKLAIGVYLLNGYSEGNKFQEKFIKE